MDLLDVALQIAEQIPDTDEYRHEGEFCWLTVGKAALAMSRLEVVERAIGEVPSARAEVELRIRALAHPALRNQMVDGFFDRWPDLLPQLWPVESHPLLTILYWRHGVDSLLARTKGISNPLARTETLCQLALYASNLDRRRAILESAFELVPDEPAGTRNDCLDEVAEGFFGLGDLDMAITVASGITDGKYYTQIREEFVTRAEESAGAAPEVVYADHIAVPAEDAFWAAAAPLIDTMHEWLERYDRTGRTMPHQADEAGALIEVGDVGPALARMREHFPTRFQPVSLMLPEPARTDFLLWQLANVAGYPRNDVRVEWLAELAAGLAVAGLDEPEALMSAASEPSFRQLQPPPVPAFADRDPSVMNVDELARFLFDRPYAADDDAKRIFQRELSNGLGWEMLSAKADWLQLLTDLFEGFGSFAAPYSVEQVDQGMLAIWGYPYHFADVLRDEAVPLEFGTRCINASLAMYRDYVRLREIPVGCTGFYMLWDIIWPHPATERDHALKRAVFHTLEQVLWFEDPYCQEVALKGLERLHPMPGASELAMAFIEQGAAATEQMLDLARYVADWETHNPEAWRLQAHTLL